MADLHQEYPGRLLPDPTREQRRDLEALGEVIATTHRIPPRHRGDLPKQIRILSEFLTSERGERPADYLSRPPLLSAYLHYFLPWNVYRQVRLLTGLGPGLLELPDRARIVDLGAGPLTFALALWIARPDLRARELEIVAVDRAGKALEAGRELFEAFTSARPGEGPEKSAAGVNWRLRTLKSDAVRARTEAADLLVAANFVNELRAGGDNEAWARQTVADLARRLRRGGRLLLIEPGTRSAARRLYHLRAAAVAGGLLPLSPCPHAAACPLTARRDAGWCHFAPRVSGAPRWLVELSRRAQLPKERAALAFLLLGGGEGVDGVGTQDGDQPGEVRIVSGPLDLPDKRFGHYACRAEGLAVVRVSRGEPPLRSGDLIPATELTSSGRDRRSGGVLLDRRQPRRPRRGSRKSE